jgi:hypothetical protein
LQPSGDYATTADLTAKQDTLDYGYHDAAISSIDASALYDASAHARINTLAGRISNLSSDKLDTTAFGEVSGDFYTTANPSGFITDEALTSYQTIEGMTAYQEAGDYYSASNPSGFISEIPDTYLQNTDLATSDGKVTAISGIPLSAGGEVPEGVMIESAVEYNAVNEISGYNGSAIAQYGAEKQWLVHDDTLVHAANSAQYALGVNLSAVAQLLGVDETVLYSGDLSQGNKDTITLSEPITNFEKFKVYGAWNYNDDCRMYSQVEIDTVNSGLRFDLNTFGPVMTTAQQSDAYCYFTVGSYKLNTSTAIDVINAVRFHTNLGAFSDSDTIKIYKVIGIGRKA